jgi:hypothetical protein
MGKTQGQHPAVPESSRSQDGEIALLSDQGIENIDSFQHQEAGQAPETRFGSPEEHQAIVNTIDHLRRTPTGQKHSAEELEDLAIDLYNRICQGIRASRLTTEEIKRAAKIFGQDPEALSRRILDE